MHLQHGRQRCTCLPGLLQVGHPQAPELVGAALKALSLW